MSAFFQEVDGAARGRSGYKAGRHSSIWCRNKEKHLLYKQKGEMILYFYISTKWKYSYCVGYMLKYIEWNNPHINMVQMFFFSCEMTMISKQQ